MLTGQIAGSLTIELAIPCYLIWAIDLYVSLGVTLPYAFFKLLKFIFHCKGLCYGAVLLLVQIVCLDLSPFYVCGHQWHSAMAIAISLSLYVLYSMYLSTKVYVHINMYVHMHMCTLCVCAVYVLCMQCKHLVFLHVITMCVHM